MIDIDKIRSQFPVLKQKINGKDLIYFDNAATSQKPKSVLDSIADFYNNKNANIHRGVHYLSQLSTDKFEATRKSIQSFINAKNTHEIIFTKGATDSINLVANGYRSILKEGDEIIISEMEHHSNIVPWQICCEISGAKLKVIPILDDGNLDMNVFKKLLSKKTKLVSITHISNSLGTINPIDKVISATHNVGAKILIDGAQATPHMIVDVQQLDVDYGKLLGKKTTDFIHKFRIDSVDFIASHGHTILHQPEKGITLQVGSGQVIASMTKQKVICDFRTQDVKLGGQGAPLVPIGDELLFSEYDYCLNPLH